MVAMRTSDDGEDELRGARDVDGLAAARRQRMRQTEAARERDQGHEIAA